MFRPLWRGLLKNPDMLANCGTFTRHKRISEFLSYRNTINKCFAHCGACLFKNPYMLANCDTFTRHERTSEFLSYRNARNKCFAHYGVDRKRQESIDQARSFRTTLKVFQILTFRKVSRPPESRKICICLK